MTTIRIKTPQPLSNIQNVIMNAWVTPGLTELWVACGTKFGKSVGASVGISRGVLAMHGGLFRWVAPIYSQTKIGFKYCKKILPPEPYSDINKSDLSITIPTIDTRLEFKSGKYPEDLEGEGVHGYALDEAAKMQRQVYDSAKTTVSITRGPIVAFSTPRGKNWFHTKCMEAKDEMEWAIKRGQPPSKMFITAPSTANSMVSAEAVEDARRSLPERLFRQYYMAEFIDDGSVFAGYRDCLFGEELPVEGAVQRWFDLEYSGGTVVVGADWAKTQDYTVFTAFDIVTHRLVGFERFHKTKYTEAIRKLVLFCRHFADVLVVRHDKTGLGSVIDDQLAYTDLPFEGVVFTNANKAEMVGQLITSVEHRSLNLPWWPEMLNEFEAFEVQTNAIGTMVYGATPGKHDDIISSLLLSHSALLQYSDSGADINFIDDLKKSKTGTPEGNTEGKDEKAPAISPIEQFYRAIEDDDDD